jgi:uncharacterized phiE125 gp8 family phage protein
MIRCVPVLPLTTQEPVTLAEAKLWLRIDEAEADEDLLIQSLMATARRRIEECHSRAFIQQTFDAVLDDVPGCDAVKLPRSPLVSVTSIRGFGTTELTDTGGTAMSSTGYYVDTLSEPGRVVLTGTDAWPTATRYANALIIRFVAGESTSSTGVQDRAKTEIKSLLASLYEHRGDEAEMAKVLAEYGTAPTDLALPEWG